MNNIFSGLEKFGLEEILKDTPKADWPSIEEPPLEEDINRFVWEKKFDCPCCKNHFTNWYPKEKRMRMVKLDLDLRPIYTPLDASFYDVIVCSLCGYAAPDFIFGKILPFQKDIIYTEIAPHFKNIEYGPRYNVIHAIERYKLALLTTITKSSKKEGSSREGEKGYLALKLSWFYKELEDETQRHQFATMAMDSLQIAMAEEHPPIMGMNYDTLAYIMGALAVYLDKREIALQSLSKVIMSKSTSKQLKDMAMTLKEDIRK